MQSRSLLGRMIVVGLVVALWAATAQAAEMTLKPVDDVFIRLFGGGEGCVAFVKFNIASVPPSQTIDSVIIQGYVWFVAANWNGDAKFFNVNSQTWQETDSAAVLHRIPTSDSTHQRSAFGQAIGWTRSVDLTAIFLRDYGAGRTFCSFKIRDPDDRTMQPMPGALASDYTDTLAVGNRAFQQHIYFYPHEYTGDTSRIIRLNVHYHGTEVSSPVGASSIVRSEVAPNPFRGRTEIRYTVANGRSRAEKATLEIFDVSGRMVRNLTHGLGSSVREHGAVACWDGNDDFGRPVPPGVYIYRCGVGPGVKTGKMVKLD